MGFDEAREELYAFKAAARVSSQKWIKIREEAAELTLERQAQLKVAGVSDPCFVEAGMLGDIIDAAPYIVAAGLATDAAVAARILELRVAVGAVTKAALDEAEAVERKRQGGRL